MQAAASWLTAKGLPATVTVPLRGIALGRIDGPSACGEFMRIETGPSTADPSIHRLAIATPAFLRASASEDPKSAVSRYEYGLALAGAERYDPAREQFEAATRLDPNLAEAHAGLADMLALQSKVAEAATRYRRALALKPGLGSAHLGLASTLDAQGKRSEAISHLELALRSSDPVARREAAETLQSLRGR